MLKLTTMKKIIIASFCLLSLTAFSQKKKTFNNPRPQAVERPNASYLQYTTTEEYNYMVKGYKIEKEGGLDPKKGYYFENPLDLADDLYSFKYYFMHRTADNSLAGVMVIAYSKAWDNTYYLAIPINNSDLVKYYYQDLEKWDKPMIQSYAKFSSALMAQFSAMLMQK